MTGLGRLARSEGIELGAFLAATERIVHGTTTADNTMIQMNGAVTALVTSEGHRDEIELRRGFKENIWDPSYPPPPAICPRRRRIGVPERLDYEGNVVEPLDEDALRRALRRLKLQNIESLAIVFLLVREPRARAARGGDRSGGAVRRRRVAVASGDAAGAGVRAHVDQPLVNAYVAPKIKRYLRNLEHKQRDAGFARELLLMQSNGGLMTAAYVANKAVSVPAWTVGRCRRRMRGRAGGGARGLHLGRHGRHQLRRAPCAAGGRTSRRHGTGITATSSACRWSTCSRSAGGGSIASVIEGALHVGLDSAGAQPGPICYRRGGKRPTVTDANLALGYLNPDYFYGGELSLDLDGVQRAIDEQIRRPLGLASGKRRRTASSAWSMPTWPTRSVACRRRAGSTRASCRWSRSAAMARCTRACRHASSRSRRCWCRRLRRRSRHSVCS